MPNQISFRYFKTSPEIIQLAVMLYVRFPLSLRNVEDLLHERGVPLAGHDLLHDGQVARARRADPPGVVLLPADDEEGPGAAQGRQGGGLGCVELGAVGSAAHRVELRHLRFLMNSADRSVVWYLLMVLL